MKRLSALPAISVVVFLLSCGNEPAKDETKTTDTTTAVAPAPAEVKPAFVPFKVVVVQHKVKNFEKSEAGYFNRDSLRNTYRHHALCDWPRCKRFQYGFCCRQNNRHG